MSHISRAGNSSASPTPFLDSMGENTLALSANEMRDSGLKFHLIPRDSDSFGGPGPASLEESRGKRWNFSEQRE